MGRKGRRAVLNRLDTFNRDPYGIEIISTYAFGSITRSYETDLLVMYLSTMTPYLHYEDQLNGNDSEDSKLYLKYSVCRPAQS